jgi:hypothetical protein
MDLVQISNMAAAIYCRYRIVETCCIGALNLIFISKHYKISTTCTHNFKKLSSTEEVGTDEEVSVKGDNLCVV